MKRNVYLNSVDLHTLETVFQNILQRINLTIDVLEIDVKSSLGNITSKPIFSKLTSPSYNASAMDGIMVKSADTFGATETSPITLDKSKFEYINTGNKLKSPFDAVIMIEDIFEEDDGNIVIYKASSQFENVRSIGEDITMNDLVINKNHKIRPIDISALISAGIKQIEVFQKIKVCIIPTGDEIINTVDDLEDGKILDSNSYYLKNELALLGIDAYIYPVQKDDYNSLESVLLNATKQYNIVIFGAGSSAGSKDFTKSLIQKNGLVDVHGINIKPGKPFIIGSISDSIIIGMPGYPVSTYVAYEYILKPMIFKIQKQTLDENIILNVKLGKKIYSSLKNHEYVRMQIGYINNEFIGTPLNRKSGVTMSVVKADAILVIPKNSEGYETGEYVDVILLKPLETIKKKIVVTGSHDLLFDLLEGEMANTKLSISSTHVGSFWGIMAMKEKLCHIAPVHILDGNDYNSSIVKEYLNDEYLLIRGVKRTQGLYVKKGNPKSIKNLTDLTRNDITFVNRQRGSGTRILLDSKLKELGISSNNINGYNLEVINHSHVASSVLNSRFDVGLGVVSIAKIYDLQFIPVGFEQYDFLMTKEFHKSDAYHVFESVFKSDSFIEKLTELGGYDVSEFGKVIL